MSNLKTVIMGATVNSRIGQYFEGAARILKEAQEEIKEKQLKTAERFAKLLGSGWDPKNSPRF